MIFKVEPTGLGGSLNVWFMCSGCEKRSLMFQGSAFVEGSKRTVVGLTLALSFLSGHGFANFNRTLRQYLGILCISKNRYYDVIKLAYPHLKDILDEMCEEEKKTCKNYHKMNWVAGHKLSLLLMECATLVDILVKMVLLLLRIFTWWITLVRAQVHAGKG